MLLARNGFCERFCFCAAIICGVTQTIKTIFTPIAVVINAFIVIKMTNQNA